MIYAFDFDGTLCENAWPDIGPPRTEVIEWAKRLKDEGHKLILWTCREGENLRKAVAWCKIHGLTFDTHNENLPEQNELYGNDSRKIGADYYVDDKAISLQELALIAKMGMESDKLPEVKRQGEEAAV